MKHLHRTHRWLGLLAALFALEMAVTGLLLNHTDALRLDERHLHAPWLLRWYGIAPAAPGPAYPVAGHWLSQWGERIFLDRRPLPPAVRGPLLGAVAADGLLLALTGQGVALLTPDGALADVLPLPEGACPRGLVRDGDGVLLLAENGRWRLDGTLSHWAPCACPAGAFAPVPPAPLPVGLRAALAGATTPGIAVERLLLDLHSGRLWGRAGVWLMDAAALAIAILALTGLTLWWRRGRRRRRP